MPYKKTKSKATKKGINAAVAAAQSRSTKEWAKKKKHIEENYHYSGLRAGYEGKSTVSYGSKPAVRSKGSPTAEISIGESDFVRPAPMPGQNGATMTGRSSSSGYICPDPDCRQCKEKRERECAELPKYYTGLRVSVSGIDPRRKVGTVIKLSGEVLPKNHIAVCLDSPVGPDRADILLEELAGPGYGVIVRESEVNILEDQCSFNSFVNVPSHVGVVVVEDTEIDVVIFKSGQTGRLIVQPTGPVDRVLVNWNFPSKNFYDGSAEHDRFRQDIPPDHYTSCYSVPRGMLALCRLDEKGRVLATWPNSGEQGDDTPWKKGDFLRILVAEPQRVTNETRNFRISPGTIVRYQGKVNRSKSEVILAGGCDPAILGVSTIINTKGLEKFEEEFIDAGGEVEITATISFRKKDLKGMRAVVILPLDQDGEVGLQFKEDIKAGSLDGHGEDKRCLYIHHSDVKRVSG